MDFITVNGECYEWSGSRFQSGYGRIKVGGVSHRAHRLAWVCAHGPIPDGLVVMHTCDNRACVRLDHLRLGTQDENMADMVAKGRSAAGERNGRAKLSNEQVASLLARYEGGETQSALAAVFGVDQTQVSYLVRRAGRGRGKGSGTRKLTDAQVAEVRSRYAAGGWSQRGLAREYGVSESLISQIVTGRAR